MVNETIELTELQGKVVESYKGLRDMGIGASGIYSEIARKLGKNPGQVSKIFKVPAVMKIVEGYERKHRWKDGADILSLEYITKFIKNLIELAEEEGDTAQLERVGKMLIDVVYKFGEDTNAYIVKVKNMSTRELLDEVIGVIQEITGKPYVQKVMKTIIDGE